MPREARKRRLRQMWLLDRLVSDDNGGVFEPFLGDAYGVYAWGRRLDPARRKELPKLVLPGDDRTGRRTRYLQSALLAWCDSCPQDQIDSLLYWPDHWWPEMSCSDHGWIPSPVREFYRRCAEGSSKRRERILQATERYLVQLDSGDDAVKSNVIRYALNAWLMLLRDIANENPISKPRHAPDDWIGWLRSTLSERPFAELAEIDRRLPPSPNREHWAKWLWIWQHSNATWRSLYSYALLSPEEHVFDRLAEITPQDQMEAWDDLLINQPADNGEMRAFCKWLPPIYAETLREYFQHSDSDWRTCAYLNYLSKAPKPVLEHHWRMSETLPRWQVRLLDRRLFAPEEARPADILADSQHMIADPRLGDPFI